jgi:hypothetical protein
MGGGGSIGHRRQWLEESLWQLGYRRGRKFDCSSGPRRGSELHHQRSLHTQHHRQRHWHAFYHRQRRRKSAGGLLSGAGISGKRIPPGGVVLDPAVTTIVLPLAPIIRSAVTRLAGGTCVED